ncbi:unnamed protein product [Amoebophrya sp. A120]|nr:unnamed protein product [Amoebophrya sp. A120]|eukprot:GSA120T00021885001.1
MKSDEYLKSRDVFLSLFLGNFYAKNLLESQSFFNYSADWSNPFITHLLVQLMDCVGWESEYDKTALNGNTSKERIAVTDKNSNWMGWSFRIQRREQLMTGFGSTWLQDRLEMKVVEVPVTGTTTSSSRAAPAGAVAPASGSNVARRKIVFQFTRVQSPRTTTTQGENINTGERQSTRDAEATLKNYQRRRDFATAVDVGFFLFLLDKYEKVESLGFEREKSSPAGRQTERTESPSARAGPTLLEDFAQVRGLLEETAQREQAVAEMPTVKTVPSTTSSSSKTTTTRSALTKIEDFKPSSQQTDRKQQQQGAPLQLLPLYVANLFQKTAERYVFFYDSFYGRDWLLYETTIKRKQELQHLFNKTIHELYSPKNYNEYVGKVVEAVKDAVKHGDVCPGTTSTEGDCWVLQHHLSPISLFYTQSLRSTSLPSLLVFENQPLKEKNWKTEYSRRYWESRYVSGGDSGKGSYGKDAEFKAGFLNSFFEEHSKGTESAGMQEENTRGGNARTIKRVLELGVGDGNQLNQANYTSWLEKYVGVDVSEFVVKKLKRELWPGGIGGGSATRVTAAAVSTSLTAERPAATTPTTSTPGSSAPEEEQATSLNRLKRAAKENRLEILHDSEWKRRKITTHREEVDVVDTEDKLHDDYERRREEVQGVPPSFDITISMDVVYHLVEDVIYDSYMAELFNSAKQFVIIFKHAETKDTDNLPRLERQHVRHRKDLEYINATFSRDFEFYRESGINPAGMCKFYVFRRRRRDKKS